jgi:hypothetical protein
MLTYTSLANIVVCRSLKVAVAFPFHRHPWLGEPIHHALAIFLTGLQAHIFMGAAKGHGIPRAGVQDEEQQEVSGHFGQAALSRMFSTNRARCSSMKFWVTL